MEVLDGTRLRTGPAGPGTRSRSTRAAGKRWTKRQIFRIIHNPIYRGSLHWQDIAVHGTHPAIVAWTPRKRQRSP